MDKEKTIKEIVKGVKAIQIMNSIGKIKTPQEISYTYITGVHDALLLAGVSEVEAREIIEGVMSNFQK